MVTKKLTDSDTIYTTHVPNNITHYASIRNHLSINYKQLFLSLVDKCFEVRQMHYFVNKRYQIYVSSATNQFVF